MKIIYLYPQTSFVSQYDSDFLFGFFLSIMRYFYGEDFTNEIVDSFDKGCPPFLFSNCFYFVFSDKNEKELYFPKPIVSRKLQEMDSLSQYSLIKSFKNQKFVPQNIFINIITGLMTEDELFEEFMRGNQTFKYSKLLKKVPTPHVQINRLTNSSQEGNFYHTEDIFINKGGLYFLFEGDFSIIEPIIRFINHYGVGADTSLGKGHFRLDFEDFEIQTTNNPNCYVNLSNYYPTLEEISYFQQNPNLFNYEIEHKSGKISTAYYGGEKFEKNKINYISQGSVFPIISGHKYYGSIKETLQVQNYSIKFNGYSLAIPAKINLG